MKTITTSFLVFAAALFVSGSARAQATNRHAKVAKQLVELINAGDYDGIQGKFNKTMSAALPLQKSSAFFKSLTQQAGKIQKLGQPRTVGDAVVFPADFERGAFDMQIVLDDRDLIAGLSFKPRGATKPGTEKNSAQVSVTERHTKAANQLVELIKVGDYAAIQKRFNNELAAALPLDKATEFFTGLKQQMGKIQKLGKPQTVDGIIVFPAEFERDTLDMQLLLDNRDQIAVLMFTPHPAR